MIATRDFTAFRAHPRPIREARITEVDTRNQLIDHWKPFVDKLEKWRRWPAENLDEGIISPTLPVVELALLFAESLSQRGAEAPTHLVPNGLGGLIFERAVGEIHLSVEIDTDLSFTKRHFREGKIVSVTVSEPPI